MYAAYKAAVDNVGTPTVILAKTVKGYGMGEAGEGQNITHQQKKMGENVLRAFRDRFGIDLPDEKIAEVPFLRLAEGSREQAYLRERREALGGALPARRPTSDPLPVPELSAFAAQLKPTGDREISTTMAFVRILTTLLRDKQIGKRVVPIVPDESRTFGMEGLFRQFGIFSQVGQLYRPEDANQLMYYKEDKSGQMLQEGINEAGAMSSWIAAATSYSVSDTPMIPFYVYYSMFGFQRIGDLAWAAGDSRARGFLMGGTAGRTTLNGEGLQHEDGHSHLISATIPNCISYDPTYAHEVAVIVQDGLRRMYAEQEDVFYYLTIMNENYSHPGMPEGREQEVAEGIKRGMYLLARVARRPARAQARPPACSCWASGTILREVEAAARAAGAGLRRRRGRVECHQLHRARPRRYRRRPLEHAASRAGTAGRVGGAAAGRAPGRSGRRGDGLHAGLRRADPASGDRPPVPGAGDRRFRPLGLPGRPAQAFRGRPPPRRARRVDRARRRGRRSVDDRRRCHRPLRHRRRQAQPGPGLKKGHVRR